MMPTNAQGQGLPKLPTLPTTSSIYPQLPTTPLVPLVRATVVPTLNFDPLKDADVLRKAMKGFGTDEDGIISILCHRTNAERMKILTSFKAAYGKDLIKEIKSEVGDDFLKLCLALLTPLPEFYCIELHDAMSGIGTNGKVLVEILSSLPNHQIREINNLYQSKYGKSLEDKLRSETSGGFQRLLVSLCNGHRDESLTVNFSQARSDATALKTAGIDNAGTDESEFNRVLCSSSPAQLQLTAQEYEKMTGHKLEDDIKNEFSGDLQDGLVAVLRCLTDRSNYFAKRFHTATSGIGTDNKSLIRLAVTRCEIDMLDIKEAFEKKYGKGLRSSIKGDTSGDFKHGLYPLIGEKRTQDMVQPTRN